VEVFASSKPLAETSRLVELQRGVALVTLDKAQPAAPICKPTNLPLLP
jgi:hypothetical protein